jgi:hypothetical protein
MAQLLTWDGVGDRFYESGIDRGVLYIPNGSGVYDTGFAWNGLVSVTETPSGAEANPQYADNIKYLNLLSAEDFGGTIEAFTYPDEFAQCDGTVEIVTGAMAGQQARKTFGLCYRTKVGNDVDGQDHGYKLHLVYGCLASPSEKAYSTINESPEALTFSWEFTTTPAPITGHSPTAVITIDSRTAPAPELAALEVILYGEDVGPTQPKLPTPDEVITTLTV